MEILYQIPATTQIDEIYEFAMSLSKAIIADEKERMFASWSAAWRRESLEHYLRLGWSFLALERQAEQSTRLVGFFLAQPYLFMNAQTQSLWVEWVGAESESVGRGLVEVAVKVAREKHFQRVLFADEPKIKTYLSHLPYVSKPEYMVQISLGAR